MSSLEMVKSTAALLAMCSGLAVFGSATGGAATYSVFQLLCLSAMFAWCCGFLQKRVPLWAVLLVAAAMAILPPSTSALLHNASTLGVSLKSMTNLLD